MRRLKTFSFILACGLAGAGSALAQGLRQGQAEASPVQAPPAGPASSARALFRLPVEIGQSALFAKSGEDVRYSFSVSALPGIGYGVLDVNALLSGIYRNPAPDCFVCTLDFGTGARATVAVVSALDGAVALRVGAEAEYLWRAASGRGAVGLIGDLSSLLRLGFWGGRDWAAGAYFWSFTVGTDIMTWGDPVGAILRPGPMEDFGDGPK